MFPEVTPLGSWLTSTTLADWFTPDDRDNLDLTLEQWFQKGNLVRCQVFEWQIVNLIVPDEDLGHLVDLSRAETGQKRPCLFALRL
jgi:hypothetical protein